MSEPGGSDPDEWVKISKVGDIPEDTDLDVRIEACVQLAWVYYHDVAAHPLDPVPLRLEGPDEFAASVGEGDTPGTVELVIDRACAHEFDRLWKEVMEAEAPVSGAPGHEAPTAFEWANLCLFWLALHEIGHLHQGHLQLLLDRSTGLQEGAKAKARLGFRADLAAVARSAGTEDKRLRQCMELQADTLATQCFLGVYSPDMSGEDLIDIRFCALAAMTVMLMIEREDREGESSSVSGVYPSPAARIFTVFGIAGHHAFAVLRRAYTDGPKSDRTEPDPEDAQHLQDYRGLVFEPLMAHLATVCEVIGGADHFDRLELGDEMIGDIGLWTRAADLGTAKFASAGAQECAALASVNALMMPFLSDGGT
jgi:hypothetical protein